MNDPRMTLHEACEALRANGMPCSEPKLRDMAVAGKFPFAYGIGGEKATVLIFRAAFYRWLDDMLGEPSVRI